MHKRTYIVLGAVFISFLALGMPDGAFGVAWPSIRDEMGMPLERAYMLVILHSVFYALSSSQIGRLAAKFKLENVSGIALWFIVLGIGGFALAPTFSVMAVATTVLGTGMGLVDSGLNAFTAKHFSAKYMNWLHCFWGMGAAISPIIMTRMIVFSGWRAGYMSMMIIQGSVAILVALSLLKGLWVMNADEKSEENESSPIKRYLTAKRYQALQLFIFFMYAGFEYAITFWTVSVLLESRDIPIYTAGMYPAVYMGFMMAGRFIFGYVTKIFSNTAVVRFGFAVSIAGLLVLTFSDNIIGMALIGFGFAPVFPCLMHETSRRFSPEHLAKLVGWQIACVGAGVGVSSFIIGRLLGRVSLEALFPVVIGCILFTVALNEIIERATRKVLKQGA